MWIFIVLKIVVVVIKTINIHHHHHYHHHHHQQQHHGHHQNNNNVNVINIVREVVEVKVKIIVEVYTTNTLKIAFELNNNSVVEIAWIVVDNDYNDDNYKNFVVEDGHSYW